MTSKYELIGEEFVTGYRQQNVWTLWIALAFFFGKIGAGLFIFAVLLDTPFVALAGLLIANIFKGGALLIHLGRPARFWRALSRPQTSWIARTVWAMGIFTAIGLVFLALPPGTVLWELFRVLALTGAIIVAVTDGFVVNDSTAIPLWNTPMLPLLFLLYSLLGGTTLFIFMHSVGWVTITQPHFLEAVEIGLLVINMTAVLIYLISVTNANYAARKSLKLLIREQYAAAFYGLVIAVGFIATLLLLLLFGAAGGPLVVTMITLADLIGHFFIFYLLLIAGVYSTPLGPLSL
ncbi:MAG: polysulfide reductase NrfD [Firmicutes bacterium]|nr:polysulfide reductase NrfD [Bacillota bacterium]